MMNETWKDITGYEGLYQVSNLGQVRSLKFEKTRILKPGNDNGYLSVSLWKDGKRKCFWIHRLVAEAFLHNPQNLLMINHKDENPSNNHVDNLEWCTQKFNLNYGTCQKRKAAKLVNGPLAKSVLQYDRLGNLVRQWPSIMEIKRQLGFHKGHICDCCNGKLKSYNGFVWKYGN